tara:strand:+ start:403 stop:585 length:183 start_codon:yes stop_codon:yes gene_type:complete
MIPKSTHIRNGAAEVVQQIMEKQFETLCTAIVEEAISSSGSNAITTDDIWIAYAKLQVLT